MLARLRDCALYFAILLASIVLYTLATRIDTSVSGPTRIGPDLWPKAVLLFLVALCLYEIARRLLHARSPDEPAAGANEAVDHVQPDAATKSVGYNRTLWASVAIVAAFVILVPWLGFFIATALFLGAFSYAGGFRRHGLNAFIALCGALMMFILFVRVAYVSLPLGIGPFQSVSIGLMRLLGVK